MIDLRSDTVTRPTPEMLEAMFAARVGDDVYGEDPATNELEEKSAFLLGTEASVFVPSGTMANQLALRAHTHPGDEVIVEATSHIFNDESGGAAALSGIQLLPIAGERGMFSPREVDASLRDASDYHRPLSRMVCIENTHNRGGGSIWPSELVREVASSAHQHGLLVHMDGARLLNATVALGVEPLVFTQHVDSVTLCLSKGLGAPVGTILAGTQEFIRQVRRFRKMFGGGMRQIGYLSAAGSYALDNHVSRLAVDHQNARMLAASLAQLDGVILSPQKVETNMFYIRLSRDDWNARSLVRALGENGVLALPVADGRVRLVTHLDVATEDIEAAAQVFRKLLG